MNASNMSKFAGIGCALGFCTVGAAMICELIRNPKTLDRPAIDPAQPVPEMRAPFTAKVAFVSSAIALLCGGIKQMADVHRKP